MQLGPNVKGAGFALASMALYSTHDAIIKALGSRYPSYQVLFFAALFTFPLLTVLLVRTGSGIDLRPRAPGWLTGRVICMITSGVCGFYAFSHLPMAQVYSILFATPLLITMLSIPILGERVGVHRWMAVAVGLVGVLIVLRPGQAQLVLAHLAALGGAIAGSTNAVITRKLGGSERTVVLMLYPMLGNFLVTGGMLTLGYTPMTLGDLGLAAIISTLSLVAGFLFIAAYRHGEASVVAPMQYSQIIWAAIFGWLLFNESLDLNTIVGASVIIASGLYIVWRESTGRSATRPVSETRMSAETAVSPKPSLLQRLLHPRRRGQVPAVSEGDGR
ncbi:DMT family transporter [Paracoccus pacificus]|uniref:DMT family transporter n=1 Tax=Paracoccus pacificus TaxID=1463598 RepID=A0ABW4R3P1_9RHOB